MGTASTPSGRRGTLLWHTAATKLESVDLERLLLLPLILLVSACDGGEVPLDIVGTWELTDYVVEASGSDATYDWYADGLRWTLTLEAGGTVVESWREGDDTESGGGTWSMEDNELSLTFDVDPGEVFTPSINELTDSRLELSFEEPWDFGDGEEAGLAAVGFDAQ